MIGPGHMLLFYEHDLTVIPGCTFHVSFPIADLRSGTFQQGGYGNIQRH